jgi:hypothetical protein
MCPYAQICKRNIEQQISLLTDVPVQIKRKCLLFRVVAYVYIFRFSYNNIF